MRRSADDRAASLARPRRWIGVLVWAGLVAVAAADGHARLDGTWRIVRLTPAPWIADAASTKGGPAVGATVHFDDADVRGPGVLDCGRARQEATRIPPDGLFQGNLPAPAARAARTLGLPDGEVPGVRLTCDAGVFEFHRADAHTVLLALDNRILTLARTPGTAAAAGAPAGAVQRLLERHFDGDMAFTAASTQVKRAWLTAALRRKIAAYFARSRPRDEVPPINGDPFTNSQEYPTRFVVLEASVAGARAEVPVQLADGYGVRRIVYHLRREAKAWRIDDLRYEDGDRLSRLLQE